MLIFIGQSAGNYFKKLNKIKIIMNNKPFYCAPGEKVSKDIRDQLDQINKAYTKSKNFSKYMEDLKTFFNLKPANITTESKLWIGGFLEGEGSLSVSAKKHNNSKFGMMLDPEFNATQHINGINHLYAILSIFQTGRIKYKSGSNATFVITIDNRQSLEEKVIPFYENYVAPYGSPTKLERLQSFKEIILTFKEEGHKDLNLFVNEMLPLWDSLRMQKVQSNESFASLQEAQDFARNFVFEKNKTK